jgi:hydrogenase-4 component E
MTQMASHILVLVLILNIILLARSRLEACIQTVALQGVLLGILPLAAFPGESFSLHLILMAAVGCLVKGWVLPRMLARAVREVRIRREMEPFVSYNISLVMGLFALGLSGWVGWHLPLPKSDISPLLVPVAIFTVFVGLFLVVARRNALNQTLGYLVFENGIFVFGVSIAREQPMLVEMGVLLDLLVGVFVMGIMVFQIQQQFDHIDVDRLALSGETED